MFCTGKQAEKMAKRGNALKEKREEFSGRCAAGSGSITIYLSLMLTLMISLISASVLSVKVQAGRMQLANSVDQAMFSLFAQYDRDVLEKYDVFFLHAGTDSGTLNLEGCLNRLTDDMGCILKPDKGLAFMGAKNLLALSEEPGVLTGYTLATDLDGAPFAAQAVGYMRETLGIQGISLIRERVLQQKAAGENAEKNAGNGAPAETYEELEQESDKAKADAEETARTAGVSGEEEQTIPVREEEAGDVIDNPLPALTVLQKKSLLNLVVKDPSEISDKVLDLTQLPGNREKETGIGVIDVKENLSDATNHLLFDEYLLKHFGSWRTPEKKAGLSYQLEYILQGRDSDIANLEGIVTKLLLMREAANIMFLVTNPGKRAEILSVSQAVAALLLLPEAIPVIFSLLTAGWAFLESLIDVRALLSGYRNTLIKTEDSWQFGFEGLKNGELSGITAGGSFLDRFIKDDPHGISYEDNLRLLLFGTDAGKLSVRTLDMAENSIRSGGRPGFRIDCCLDSLSAELSVKAEGRFVFKEQQTCCYRDM